MPIIKLERRLSGKNVPNILVPATVYDALSDAMRYKIKPVLIKRRYSNIWKQVPIDLADSPDQIEEVRSGLSGIEKLILIDNNSDPVQEFYRAVGKDIGHEIPPGKGRNVFSSMGIMRLLFPDKAMALNDADIETFSKYFFEGLIAPYMEDQTVDFTKANYVRIGENGDGERRLYGRVRRLFVAPFLEALAETYKDNEKVRDYSEFLMSIKYPLSGEFVMSPRFASSIELQPDWALEIGSLSWTYENKGKLGLKIAQPFLGVYNHKHQDVSEKDPSKGLHKMVKDIVLCKLHYVVKYDGEVNDDELIKNYGEAADRHIEEDYPKLAKEHNCVYDAEAEKRMATFFEKRIKEASEELKTNGKLLRLPAWSDEMVGRYASMLEEAVLLTNPHLDYMFAKGKGHVAVPVQIGFRPFGLASYAKSS